MTGPRVVRERLRRQYSGPGGSVNVAADVNAVVGGGGSASSKQTVRVSQGRAAQTGTAETEEDA